MRSQQAGREEDNYDRKHNDLFTWPGWAGLGWAYYISSYLAWRLTSECHAWFITYSRKKYLEDNLPVSVKQSVKLVLLGTDWFTQCNAGPSFDKNLLWLNYVLDTIIIIIEHCNNAIIYQKNTFISFVSASYKHLVLRWSPTGKSSIVRWCQQWFVWRISHVEHGELCGGRTPLERSPSNNLFHF